MKKSLSVILAVIALLLALVITIPMMISWDQYKTLIQTQFTNATGRTLHINGDLRFALLPSPRATMNDVVIDNPVGAMSKSFATVKSLDVGVALLPLLSKDIRITHIKVEEPAVTLETMADGKNNWGFAPIAKEATPTADTNNTATTQNISVDDFKIEKAFVRIVNVPQKSQNVVGPMDGSFKIESATGPFSGRGTVTVNEKTPVRFEMRVDALPEEKTAPIAFNLGLNMLGGAATGEFKGSVTREPALNARIESVLATKHLDKILTTMPTMLSPQTSVKGLLEYKNNQVRMDNLLFNSGGTEVSGGLVYDTATPRPRLTLDLARMTLPPEQKGKAADASTTKEAAKPLAETLSNAFAQGVSLLDAKLPSNDLDIVLTANQLAFPGQPPMRDLRIAASNSAKSVTLQTLDVKTNDMDVHVAGELPRRADGAFERADLNAQIGKGDLNVTSGVKMTRENLRLEPLAISQKGETVNGGIVYAPKSNPALAVAIKGSALDLDSLINSKSSGKNAKATDTKTTAAATDTSALLKGLQAKIDVDLGRVTWQGKSAQQVKISTLASEKGLAIQTARIGDLGGMVIEANGSIARLSPLSGVAITANGKTPDLSATLRSLGNAEAKNLGASQFNADIKGGEDALQLVLNGTIDQGKVALQATKNKDGISGMANITHPETATIVRNFAKMNPKTTFGPFALKTNFVKGEQTLQTKDMVVEMGSAGTLRGDIDIQPKNGGRSIHAALKADTLNLAALMGDTDTTSTTAAPTQADTTAKSWSTEPLDLDSLRGLDGNATISIGKLLVKKFVLDDFKTDLRFANNTITLNNLSGKFFDAGSFSTSGQLAVGAKGSPHRGDITLKIDNTDAKKLFMALGSNVFEKGIIDTTQKLSFNGASQAQLISSLSGSGSVNIQQAIINGIDLDALADKLDKPNSLGDFAAILDVARAGGQTAIGDVTMPISVQSGMAQIQETSVKTAKTAMATKGLINLPNKSLDMMGQITFVEQRNLPPLTLFIKGPISQPQKSFDTRAFTQFYAQKATEKLQNKLEDKLQNKLNKVLGVPEAQTPAPDATTTAPTASPDATMPQAAPAAPAQSQPKDQLKQLGTQMLNNLLNNGGMQ